MWPVLRHDQILKLHEEQSKQQQSATSTISNNESRTMRSAETQTELLECSGDEEDSSEDANEELEVISTHPLELVESQSRCSSRDGKNKVKNDDEYDDEDDDEDDDDDDYEDILGEEAKLKSIKRLNCSTLFNFNKLELLNERCLVIGQQPISDSSRNLCEHEMHVAIDEELEVAAGRRALPAGEGKRTMLEDCVASSSVIFIQESPEVIL